MSIIGEIKTSREEWIQRMMAIATEVATWSKDPKTKVGAVIVSADHRRVAWGYNGFPRGTADLKQRLMDPDDRKYMMVHAEKNAMDNAGFDVAGCTLYVTVFPCAQCAASVINSRIARVVAPVPDLRSKAWGDSWSYALEMLSAAGVEVVRIKTEFSAEDPK